MKKILMILMSSMLSLIALAQSDGWISRISETEISESYSTTTNDGKETNNLNTIEDCIKEYLLTTNNMDEFHVVINNIEKGTLKAYLDNRKDKGLISPEEIHNIGYIKYMIKATFSFVSNGKIYVLTYEPIKCEKGSSSDNSTQFTHKNLYLYRRDDNGWKKASDLIREDVYIPGEFMRSFNLRTSFAYENVEGWSVNKITNGSVFITFSTQVWTPETEHHSYNCILVFVPIDNGNYHVAYFEPPKNKQDKIVKNYKFVNSETVQDGNNNYKTVKKTVVEDTEFPVLCGTYAIDYVETPDGLTINYWDGDSNNPIKAGTLNFKISGTFVTCDGTIKLNRLLW